jgi:BlaI family transcriptional regulator, penicillinase repressor
MKLSESEWELMSALWKRYPATARDVIGQLPDESRWAYTTVKTMLTRLVQKGALEEKKRGAISIYEPLLSQKTARNHALKTLVDRVLGGAIEPIMHFLIEEKKLSAKERQRLIQMLEQMDQPLEDHSHDIDK